MLHHLHCIEGWSSEMYVTMYTITQLRYYQAMYLRARDDLK
jgi:hypothetical protein